MAYQKNLRTSSRNHFTNNLRGGLLMAAAAASVSLMHALVRDLSNEVHPFQIAFFRSFATFMIFVPLLTRVGPEIRRSRRPLLQGVRGILGAGAMLTWFYGLSLTPIADATALNFAGTIFITLGAIFILGEFVGFRRWTAIAIGIIGTLIILRPGFQNVGPGTLIILVSTLLWASSLLVVKVLSRTDSSVTIVFYSTLYSTPLSLVPALFVWKWPTVEQLVLLTLIGTLATIGHLTMTQAYRDGEASVVAPIDFTRLIWTTVLGYLFFSELPDVWIWVGASLIILSATYITLRETKVKGASARSFASKMPSD